MMAVQINFQDIKKELTVEQIIELVIYLGAETYENKGKHIIFPTICHNPRHHDKSMKMYYYPDTSLFRCYTECNESFDIFDLWQRVSRLDGHEKSLFEIVEEISRRYNLDVDSFEKVLRYKQPLSAKITGTPFYEYTVIPSTKLNFFEKRRIRMWESEGISPEAIDKYEIKFYPYKNKIIIPHFDVNSNLIGIRVRNIEPEDLAYGKYMPAQVGSITYSHPLSFNLYGLNISKDIIKRDGVAYLFEGEKSCLKFETFYPDANASVATCGSSLNKFQVMLLKKHCNVREIVICFDRQFDNIAEEEKYFNKLYDLAEKYNSYCQISFVFDDDKLLGYKDSPVDKGKEIFEKLISERRFVRNNK